MPDDDEEVRFAAGPELLLPVNDNRGWRGAIPVGGGGANGGGGEAATPPLLPPLPPVAGGATTSPHAAACGTPARLHTDRETSRHRTDSSSVSSSDPAADASAPVEKKRPRLPRRSVGASSVRAASAATLRRNRVNSAERRRGEDPPLYRQSRV